VWPQCWLCAVCAVGHIGCCVGGEYPVGVSISSSRLAPNLSPGGESAKVVMERISRVGLILASVADERVRANPNYSNYTLKGALCA